MQSQPPFTACWSLLTIAVLLAAALLPEGENIDRNGVCKDSSQSVVVKITDTCPCNYPNNYFSESLSLSVVVQCTCRPVRQMALAGQQHQLCKTQQSSLLCCSFMVRQVECPSYDVCHDCILVRHLIEQTAASNP
jgi:hypothetical protein